MKAMISQPMVGLTDEEILATREKATKVLESKGYEVVNTFFSDEYHNQQMMNNDIVHIPVYFMAKSIEKMSLCDAVYLCKGFEWCRGCMIEHDIALAYGLNLIYEEEDDDGSV
jgi:hypothetical protein